MGNYKRKVFLTMEGGVIHNLEVSPDLKDIEFVIIDFDTEGIESVDLSLINGEEAYIKRGPSDGVAKPSNYKITRV